jgi:hypothetical protein
LFEPTLTGRSFPHRVRHALVGDRPAGVERFHPVRAGAERRLERRLADVALLAVRVGAFPPVLRQHRQLAEDVRQFAVARLVEDELHLVVAEFLGRRHVRVVVLVEGMDLPERLERPDHVVGGDRRAVVPLRFRPEAVAHPGVVGGILRRLGDQAVLRRGVEFVERRRHQRFEDEAGARRDVALWDEGVEAVEAAGGAEPQQAAFRRLRVGVGEVREVGRQLRLAGQRHRRMPGKLAGRSSGRRGVRRCWRRLLRRCGVRETRKADEGCDAEGCDVSKHACPGCVDRTPGY